MVMRKKKINLVLVCHSTIWSTTRKGRERV